MSVISDDNLIGGSLIISVEAMNVWWLQWQVIKMAASWMLCFAAVLHQIYVKISINQAKWNKIKHFKWIHWPLHIGHF